ncbi:MAG: very short patch repair endonuclease [Candidatus Electrothrix sp. YB6]
MPGSPDLVLPKYKAAVFVHGCYWHRHEGCSRATVPKSNTEFWQKKFNANVARDRRVQKELEELHWLVVVLWECEIINDPTVALNMLVNRLEQKIGQGICRKYSVDMDRRQILQLAEEKSRYYLENAKKQNR